MRDCSPQRPETLHACDLMDSSSTGASSSGEVRDGFTIDANFIERLMINDRHDDGGADIDSPISRKPPRNSSTPAAAVVRKYHRGLVHKNSDYVIESVQYAEAAASGGGRTVLGEVGMAQADVAGGAAIGTVQVESRQSDPVAIGEVLVAPVPAAGVFADSSESSDESPCDDSYNDLQIIPERETRAALPLQPKPSECLDISDLAAVVPSQRQKDTNAIATAATTAAATAAPRKNATATTAAVTAVPRRTNAIAPTTTETTASAPPPRASAGKCVTILPVYVKKKKTKPCPEPKPPLVMQAWTDDAKKKCPPKKQRHPVVCPPATDSCGGGGGIDVEPTLPSESPDVVSYYKACHHESKAAQKTYVAPEGQEGLKLRAVIG